MNEPVVPLKEYTDTRFIDFAKNYDVKISYVEKQVDARDARDAALFQKIDQDFETVGQKITSVNESISDEISKVKLEIVGKEIFTAYVQRTADDIQDVKDSINVGHGLTAQVRENAANALALAVVEQNKAIAKLEKPPWGTYLTMLGIFLGVLSGLGTGFNYMVIQPMMRKDEIIEARVMKMEDHQGEGEKLLDRNYSAIQENTKAISSLIEYWKLTHGK